MSAGKTFGLPWEHMSVEFRADASNVFNHKSLGIPDERNLGSSAGVGQPYGATDTISTVTTGARNLQLSLRVSF
jgi:hypothetical protein